MSDIKILVEVTREQQLEIEDICHRDGLGISQYLIGLHEGEKQKRANRQAALNPSSLPTQDDCVDQNVSVQEDEKPEKRESLSKPKKRKSNKTS